MAAACLTAVMALGACHLEKPDPAAQANAILNAHPSDFLDQLAALDAMASQEADGFSDVKVSQDTKRAPRPALTEEVFHQSASLKPRLEAAKGDSEKVAILNAWIFDSLKIIPQPENLTLRASLPSQVLIRREGSCLGLTLVYLALGKSLGLPLSPVFLPGHIFVRYRSSGFVRNIETLRGGIARSDSFYQARFSLTERPWYTLKDAEPKQALAALVFNLANTHRAKGEWKWAAEEYRLAEAAIPGFPEALGNYGAALLTLGDKPAAQEKLSAALAGDSLAEPAWRDLALIYKSAGDAAKAEEAERRADALAARSNSQVTETAK